MDELLPSSNPFAIANLRLPERGDLSFRVPLPRHAKREPFIKGPISYHWITSACQLPGIGLHISMTYRLHNKLFPSSRARHWGVKDMAEGLRVSLPAVRRGFRSAEQAGLIVVIREPGQKVRITISGGLETVYNSKHRALRGPIPWSWWLPASRLPGRSLQVAALCWTVAGWERSAKFEIPPKIMAEFGISRPSMPRGLAALEGAGLIAVVRRPGLSPVVTILEPPDTRSDP
jgi:hypothetical protein